MYGHVHEGTASGKPALLTPGAFDLRVPTGELGTGRYNFSQTSLCDGFLHHVVEAVVTHHETGGREHALGLGRFKDFGSFHSRQCYRLFHQDMLPRRDRHQGLFLVVDDRRGYIYGVHFLVGYQGCGVRIRPPRSVF